MDNKEMLETAIQKLSSIDAESIETVQIEHTKYDDGSVGFAVNITFPATVKEEE